MAAKINSNEKLLPIEELKQEKKVSNDIYEGAKAGNNWTTGKYVTRKEFDDAINGFLNNPIKGR